MSENNLGKQFEAKLKEDFLRSFPQGTLERLMDSMNGYKYITSVSDFIGYNYPNMFYIECKSHKGASIPFDNISQYDKLKSKVGIKGVRALVILWLYEKDKVLAIPVSTITQMKRDGKKSVGLKSIEEGYNIIEIPSKKKRTFMDSDYSILMYLDDEDKLVEVENEQS